MKSIRIVVALLVVGIGTVSMAQSNAGCNTRCTYSGDTRVCTTSCHGETGATTQTCVETCRFDGGETRCSISCY